MMMDIPGHAAHGCIGVSGLNPTYLIVFVVGVGGFLT